MCLIVVIKSGVEKYSDFLLKSVETASFSNYDGIGFTFKRKSTGKIFISKGYKEYEDFLKVYKNKNLSQDDEVLIHLRIGNKGAKSVEMNHPFVVSNDKEEILLNHKYVSKPTLVHNGTFSDHAVENSKYSDTFFFIENFMSIPEVLTLLKRDLTLFKSVFTNVLKTNRLAMLFPGNDKLLTIGNFIEDEKYLFSNLSYTDSTYSNVGGVDIFSNGYRRNLPNKFDEVYNRNIFKKAQSNSRFEDLIEEESGNNYKEHLHKSNRFSVKQSINHSDITKFEKQLILEKSIFVKEGDGTFLHNFCDVLYIPLTKSVQYGLSKFILKKWNYQDFNLVATESSRDSGIVQGKSYKITCYDELGENHILTQVIDNVELNCTFISDVEIYNKMYVTPRGGEYGIYYDVYKLLCTGNVMSKNQFKKLGKTITKFETKKKYDSLTYQSISSLKIKTLEILYNYTLEYLEDFESVNRKLFIKNLSSSRKETLLFN